MADVDDRPANTEGQPDKNEDAAPRRRRSRRRFAFIMIGIVAAVATYAFAFEKTDVDLQEITSERRQQSLFRILRDLAHPDLITYSNTEVDVSVDVLIPCNTAGPALPEAPRSGPRLIVIPPCADPGDTVTVEGIDFAGRETGTLAFVPDSDFDITLSLGRFSADESGFFSIETELPERTSDKLQQIEAVTRVNIGSIWNFLNPFDAPDTAWDDFNGDGIRDPGEVLPSPRWSSTASSTWDLIVETVMLALLATTIGTLLAIPLSFLAARNLMSDIATPVVNIALTVIALPIGVRAGVEAADLAFSISDPFVDHVLVELAGIIIIPILIWLAIRWALPTTEDKTPTPAIRVGRVLALLGVVVAGILGLIVLSAFAIEVGETVDRNLGALGFFGNFVARLGEILDVVIKPLAALVGAGVLAVAGGRLAYAVRSLRDREGSATSLIALAVGVGALVAFSVSTIFNAWGPSDAVWTVWVSLLVGGLIGSLVLSSPPGLARVAPLALAPVAGAVAAIAGSAAISWFGGFESTVGTFWIPLFVGAALGLIQAARAWTKESVGTGLTVYYVARTIFNTLRSIEPLIMVIVFVVWVGIGPFAGTLALALHTTAALAKLYSEQVESITTGPIEAIRATGATRVQTIVYGVVPQIVPPYIAFTMYRWDINVRLSTIIGFGGGGGIGFLLQQNINLLQYQDAATQMLAIAIVVASMDYTSSKLRQRVV